MLLLLLELGLRRLNPAGLLPDGSEERAGYRSLVVELQRRVPEVVVVGSSRARRGVLAPNLRGAIEQSQGVAVVKNFGLQGAEAEEVELVVRRMAEVLPHPKLIVWPITPRDLEVRSERPSPHVRYLWRVSDWLAARGALGSAADAYLPAALKNEAGRYSYMARYRFAMQDVLDASRGQLSWQALEATFMPETKRPTPMQGGIPDIFQSTKRNQSRKVSASRVREYLGDAYTQPTWPRNYQAEHLEATIRQARALGVPIVFVEIPVHDVLTRMMPAGAQEKFLRYMEGVAQRHDVRFVSAEHLGESFERTDFSEQSHLNYRGATKYTNAIAPIVSQALAEPGKK